ncbi:MAG: alanine racemase [Miltoncostaeaceae bacterium]|jgi:alanine racemase|nr:alanine racemase [Miltoncostaeaceae bacterium]
MSRERALARVDRGAIRANARLLARAAGRAELMAVVKADGYGHGATAAALAALEGGARRLAVATAAESEALRSDGIGAPLLVMGPLVGREVARAIAAHADIVAWTPQACLAAAAAGRAAGRPARVHLKLDTGMGRLGARPEDVAALVEAADRPGIEVAGIMTHFATADLPAAADGGFFREQLLRFRAAADALRPRFPGAALHAANSAATLRAEEGLDARLDVVRCGIALYGCSPFGANPDEHGLRPAMSLVSYVAAVKTVRSMESVGYGRAWRASRGTRVAAVPIGYGDGYSRSLSNRAEVLVGGRRRPVVGTISMDQLTVELGPDGVEEVGDEVVLIGRQGDERITVEEIARLRDTINYEVTTGLGTARVRRVHEDGP